MVTAYVLAKAHTGDADRIKGDIEHVEGVVDASIVAGDVDFIAKVEVNSPAAVKDVAATGIQSVQGIEDTQTYIAMD